MSRRGPDDIEFDTWGSSADDGGSRSVRWVDAPAMRIAAAESVADDEARRPGTMIAIVVTALVVVAGAVVYLTRPEERAPLDVTATSAPVADTVVAVGSDEGRSTATGTAPGAVGETLPGAEGVVEAPPLPGLGTLPSAAPSTLPYPGTPIDEGRFTTGLLGIPMAFTVSDPTALRTARDGLVLLTPGGTSATDIGDARHVQFVRVGGWNTPEQAVDALFRGVGGIAPHDIDGWVAANDVVVDATRPTVVAGRSATVYDLRVDQASEHGHGVCLPEFRPCFWFVSVPAGAAPVSGSRLDYALYGPTAIRFWFVEIEGGLPLLIEAAVPTGEEAWLDRFEVTTIATLELGPQAGGLPD